MSIELPPSDYYEQLARNARLAREARMQSALPILESIRKAGAQHSPSSTMPEVVLDLAPGEQLPD